MKLYPGIIPHRETQQVLKFDDWNIYYHKAVERKYQLNLIRPVEVTGKRVAFDIDDTLGVFSLDFIRSCAFTGALPAETFYTYQPGADLEDLFPGETDIEKRQNLVKQLRYVEKCGYVYKLQPIRIGAVTAVHRVLEKADEVLFVTARPERTNPLTERWLKNRFQLDQVKIINAANKHTVADEFDVLFDDSPFQHQRLAKDGKSLVMMAQGNPASYRLLGETRPVSVLPSWRYLSLV